MHVDFGFYHISGLFVFLEIFQIALGNFDDPSGDACSLNVVFGFCP